MGWGDGCHEWMVHSRIQWCVAQAARRSPQGDSAGSAGRRRYKLAVSWEMCVVTTACGT